MTKGAHALFWGALGVRVRIQTRSVLFAALFAAGFLAAAAFLLLDALAALDLDVAREGHLLAEILRHCESAGGDAHGVFDVTGVAIQ